MVAYILNQQVFAKHKQELDSFVFWKQVSDVIVVKRAVPSMRVKRLLNSIKIKVVECLEKQHNTKLK